MSFAPSRPVTPPLVGEVRWGWLLLALFVVLSARTAAALEPLPTPEGPVLLTVDGSIAVTNNGEQADFDRAMLAELGLSEIRTTTAWTDGMQIFEGVLLASVGVRAGPWVRTGR